MDSAYLDPHLIHGSLELDTLESAHKRHLDRFSRFVAQLTRVPNTLTHTHTQIHRSRYVRHL